jgi:hypothetical protein
VDGTKRDYTIASGGVNTVSAGRVWSLETYASADGKGFFIEMETQRWDKDARSFVTKTDHIKTFIPIEARRQSSSEFADIVRQWINDFRHAKDPRLGAI